MVTLPLLRQKLLTPRQVPMEGDDMNLFVADPVVAAPMKRLLGSHSHHDHDHDHDHHQPQPHHSAASTGRRRQASSPFSPSTSTSSTSVETTTTTTTTYPLTPAERVVWEAFTSHHVSTHGAPPPLILQKLFHHPKQCFATGPRHQHGRKKDARIPFAVFDRVYRDLQPWRYVKDRQGVGAVRAAAQSFLRRVKENEHFDEGNDGKP